MAGVIRDPRLLPAYMTEAQAAALCQVSPRTIRRYCQTGILLERVHFTRPRGATIKFLRDGLLDWLDGIDQRAPQAAPRSKSKLNLSMSPALASIAGRA